MLKKIICAVICIVLLSISSLYGDTIYLKNENKVSGIILKENHEDIEIKVNIGAVVNFSKDEIVRIERGSDIEHARMEVLWEEEKARREARKKEEEVFREEQEKKGFVKYRGKWIMPEERERLQAALITRGIDKRYDRKAFSYKRHKGKKSSFAGKLLGKGNWFIRESEHFSIFYTELSQAKIISDRAEYYFEKITYDLGVEDRLKWNRKCQVYIVENVNKWEDFLKGIGFSADLVGGFVPDYDEREMFLCAVSEGYLALTFPHELTHLIFREIAGSSTIPLWLSEGLGNYEAGMAGMPNELLTDYIKKGRHIVLGDLIRMTSYPTGKEAMVLFYAQSEKLVEFLIAQYGRKKFRKFCELIFEDRSFKDSLSIAYKRDFKHIEDFNIKLLQYIVR